MTVLSDCAEDRIRKQAITHLRRNYLAYLAHGLLGQTGMRLINAPTFVPAYVFALSGSELVVGLARALQYFGMFLSPILGATLVEHRRKALPLAFWVGGAMRLQILGLAAAGLFFPDRWALAGVLFFLGFFGFFLGMQGVIFSTIFAKVIPVERRGILLGLRNSLSGLTAAGVAYLGGRYLVADGVLGNGFGATFAVAFVLTSLGLGMLFLVREPESIQIRERSSVRERFRDLPGLMQSDRAFTYYFVARSLATMGRMALPFYFLFAYGRMDIDEGTALGVLSVIFLLAQTVTNGLWGGLADRGGFRRVFLGSLAIWIAAGVWLMHADGLWGTGVAFAGIGIGLGGFMLAAQNMVLEFGEREDLPLRVAVSNSASELTGAVGPLVGGLLVVFGSYLMVFWAAIGFQACAAIVILAFVREPRHRGRDFAR